MRSAQIMRPRPLRCHHVQPNTLRDHQQMLDQLHITSMRPGPGNHKDAPPPNFDESKANPYPKLPDPLILNNGKKVTTAKMWWQQRRPQIVEYFDREVYGRVPHAYAQRDLGGRLKPPNETAGQVPSHYQTAGGPRRQLFVPAIAVNIRLTLPLPPTPPARFQSS
jgi:hypothetical protein